MITEYELTTKIRDSEILAEAHEEEILNFVRHVQFNLHQVNVHKEHF